MKKWLVSDNDGMLPAPVCRVFHRRHANIRATSFALAARHESHEGASAIDWPTKTWRRMKSDALRRETQLPTSWVAGTAKPAQALPMVTGLMLATSRGAAPSQDVHTGALPGAWRIRYVREFHDSSLSEHFDSIFWNRTASADVFAKELASHRSLLLLHRSSKSDPDMRLRWDRNATRPTWLHMVSLRVRPMWLVEAMVVDGHCLHQGHENPSMHITRRPCWISSSRTISSIRCSNAAKSSHSMIAGRFRK